MANICVIGSGGREHAICWKLSQSSKVKKVYAVPGSHGIGQLNKAECLNLDVKNFKAIGEWAKKNEVGLVIVGPEDPLADGIADVLSSMGILCFGPSASAAKIEADKAWSKAFMVRHGVPTARYKDFTKADEAKAYIKSADFPALVVKASGLAAGKGVVVAATKEEACEAVDSILTKFGKAGEVVVVEELLEGEEVSVLCFTDGKEVRPMLPAQDHKRIWDGDKGANTGGMGAVCPCPLISHEELATVTETVLKATVSGLAKEGCPFVGVLYAGLMMTKDGPKVLEFNCRFGDPETQVILPLLDSDLFEIMMHCCTSSLNKHPSLDWKQNLTAVGVVMASKGYPESSSKGDHITGLESVTTQPGMIVFHSGVRAGEGGRLETNGGRVLIAVSLSPSIVSATATATAAVRLISFPGKQFRSDIAHKVIPRWTMANGKLSYKASGVDIVAGNNLVSAIKPLAAASSRTGVLEGLGGFGAMFSTKVAGYQNPILVSGTDGVGTKLKIAFSMNKHDTVGQDLVAMCVNDILCHGAEPLFFLDYFATGKLEVDAAKDVVAGVAKACAESGCALVGGETAEMPGLYAAGEYDLAGFACGAVESGNQLPKKVSVGDCLIALPSSGVHSNGYSLVRRVIESQHIDLKSKSPFSSKILGEELLTPTRLYVKDVLPAIKAGKIKALAHITGGGLLENIPRVLTEDVSAILDAAKWNIPPIFPWIAQTGGVSEKEMLRTFNCGIGMLLVVDTKDVDFVMKGIPDAKLVGSIQAKSGCEQVVVNNFSSVMEPLLMPHVKTVVEKASGRKRIGVLISGTGSDLQAMIDAVGKGQLDADIVLVVSNKPGVMGLTRAEKAGIPSMVIKHQNYSTRETFEEAVDTALRSRGVEIVVLAGFMRVLTGFFVNRWRGALINIHPALLPLFKGTHAQKQALDAGVRVSGCTVHFVEEDVDAGAIIAQAAVPIYPGDKEEDLIERIKAKEHEILPVAVQLVCSGQVKLDTKSNKLVWL